MFHHPKRYFIDNRPLHVDATGKATDKELRVALPVASTCRGRLSIK